MADFTLPGAKTASFTFHGTGFVNLEFTNGAGDTEFGYATFNTSDGTLESITYQTAGSTAAVPESSTWAMLIAGAGVTGLVVHRRRRRSALLAAA